MAILDQLAQMGADALANHYAIVFPPELMNLAVNGYSGNQFAFRITNVSIPEKTIATYAITKRGLTFDRPSGNNESSREVSFTFRPDKKFLTYKALSAWMDLIQSNVDMTMASDSGPDWEGGSGGGPFSLFRVDIDIWAIKNLNSDQISGDKFPTAVWNLKSCFPTSLGSIEFDDTNGEPLTVDVTLNCFKIYYPDENLSGVVNVAEKA